MYFVQRVRVCSSGLRRYGLTHVGCMYRPTFVWYRNGCLFCPDTLFSSVLITFFNLFPDALKYGSVNFVTANGTGRHEIHRDDQVHNCINITAAIGV